MADSRGNRTQRRAEQRRDANLARQQTELARKNARREERLEADRAARQTPKKKKS